MEMGVFFTENGGVDEFRRIEEADPEGSHLGKLMSRFHLFSVLSEPNWKSPAASPNILDHINNETKSFDTVTGELS